MRAVFIRAPWVEEVGPGVEVLAEVDGRPVLARDGRFLVAAFHPGADRRHAAARDCSSNRQGGEQALSGHSKWSSIKHKKGAADAKRGKLFSKLSRAIIVAAKEGGGDPANNLALQNAIEKAKSYSMPKDNIDRAIAKGSGADADADAFETIVYEGYGPEGVAVIVEALTDNRNRTAADVRHMFAKHGGNLGATGAVAWQFDRRGVVVVPADGVDEEELLLVAADGGADDIERDGDVFQVTSAPESLSAVRGAIEAAGFTVDSAELDARPEDDGRGRGRGEGAAGDAPDRRARGQRRRPGRLRELRHPRAGARGRRRLVAGPFAMQRWEYKVVSLTRRPLHRDAERARSRRLGARRSSRRMSEVCRLRRRTQAAPCRGRVLSAGWRMQRPG